MRSGLFAALAGAAAAAPAFTLTKIIDVTTTVYDDGAPATASPPARAFGAWGQGKAPGYWPSAYTSFSAFPRSSSVSLRSVSAGPRSTVSVAAPSSSSAAAPRSTVSVAAPVSSPVSSAVAATRSTVSVAAPASSASVAPPASSAPASNPGAGQPTPSSYSAAVVAHHNAHRANHSAPNLVWDAALAATANKIASSCVYAHDVSTDGGGYGQNIAAGVPANNISAVITDLFYNNEVGNFKNLYGQPTPSNINDAQAFDGYGHFTQIVWKATTRVGCATYDCSSKGLKNTGSNVPAYFTVCNYGPAGNYLGEFATNVGRPLGYPSISWAST